MKRCTQCLLPETFPRVRFNEDGRCNFCAKHERKHPQHDTTPSPRDAARKARLKARMERLLERKRGQGEYDCLIGFSGGKDSTFLLNHFKEVYGLRVLAYTCDTGFLADVARDNITHALSKLGVDHVWRRPCPSFYHRMYAKLLGHPPRRGCVRTICPNCFRATVIKAFQIAIEKQIPLVVLGLSPGQLPFRAYRVSRWIIMALVALFKCSPRLLMGVSLSKEEKAEFDIPLADFSKIPDVILPFQALEYDIERNTESILDKGLVERGKESPLVTNCLVNLAMMETDWQCLGHNPYAKEFAELLREGQIDRDEWLAVDEQIRQGTFEREKIDFVREKLGLPKSQHAAVNEGQ